MTYFIENCYTFLVTMYCPHLYSNNPTDEVTINRQTLHFLTFMSDRKYECPIIVIEVPALCSGYH